MSRSPGPRLGARAWAALTDHAAVAPALAVVIALYGGLLRLDAFVGKYGTLDHPGWARIVTENVAPLVPAIRPAHVGWAREPRPYVGGDPINYIKSSLMKGEQAGDAIRSLDMTLSSGSRARRIPLLSSEFRI